MMYDCSDEIIIADSAICAWMQARANEFAATHPSGGLQLSGFNAWYYKNTDGIEQISIGASEPIPVGPNMRQMERALKSAGYTITETVRGPWIYAPKERYDMICGVARALAWIRANPPGETRDLATYYARYLSAKTVGKPHISNTRFKHIVLYVHHHMWSESGPMTATRAEIGTIGHIRFE